MHTRIKRKLKSLPRIALSDSGPPFAAMRITESDLPLSPIFIDFIARWLDKSGFAGEEWFDQRSAALSHKQSSMRRRAESRLQRLLSDATAQGIFEAVYSCFYNLATASPLA